MRISYPWDWQRTDYDDSAWVGAHEVSPAAPRDARDAPNRWMLTPRAIPLEEQTPQRILKIRKAEGIAAPENFPMRASPVKVPAHTTASLLLDQTYLTTAYPVMTVSGGKGSTINLHYAESLYVQKSSAGQPTDKGNRNDVEGKKVLWLFGYISCGRRVTSNLSAALLADLSLHRSLISKRPMNRLRSKICKASSPPIHSKRERHFK